MGDLRRSSFITCFVPVEHFGRPVTNLQRRLAKLLASGRTHPCVPNSTKAVQATGEAIPINPEGLALALTTTDRELHHKAASQ